MESTQPEIEGKKPVKGSVVRFIRQLKEEIQKISWTGKAELFFLTKLVVISVLVFGMSVYLVDLVIKSILDFIGLSIRSIFG